VSWQPSRSKFWRTSISCTRTITAFADSICSSYQKKPKRSETETGIEGQCTTRFLGIRSGSLTFWTRRHNPFFTKEVTVKFWKSSGSGSRSRIFRQEFLALLDKRIFEGWDVSQATNYFILKLIRNMIRIQELLTECLSFPSSNKMKEWIKNANNKTIAGSAASGELCALRVLVLISAPKIELESQSAADCMRLNQHAVKWPVQLTPSALVPND